MTFNPFRFQTKNSCIPCAKNCSTSKEAGHMIRNSRRSLCSSLVSPRTNKSFTRCRRHSCIIRSARNTLSLFWSSLIWIWSNSTHSFRLNTNESSYRGVSCRSSISSWKRPWVVQETLRSSWGVKWALWRHRTMSGLGRCRRRTRCCRTFRINFIGRIRSTKGNSRHTQ